MKKIILTFTLMLTLSLVLTACGNKKETNLVKENLKELRHINENYNDNNDNEDIELDKNITEEDIKEAHILFITEYIASFEYTINNSFPEYGIVPDEDYNRFRKQAEELLERADKEVVSIYGENTLDPERATYFIAGLHLEKNAKDLQKDFDNFTETDYIKLMAKELEESDDKEITFEEIISPSGKNYKIIQDLIYFEEVYIDSVQSMKKYL